MRSTTTNLRFCTLIFVCLVSSTVKAQDKFLFFGGSKTFRSDSIGHTFQFSFNRTESVEPEAGPLIKAWKFGKGGLFLRPSASASLGSLTKVAEDNVLVDVSLGYHQSLGKGFVFITDFAPTYTSEKNFKTGLLFAELTPKLGYRSFNEESAEHLIVAKVGFDYGKRVTVKQNPDNFTRVIPNLSYRLAFLPVLKTNNGNREFQFFVVTLNMEGQAFLIKGDETIIPNGTYGHFSSSLDVRINKKIALTLKYANGYVQPTFKQVNSLSFGFSVFQ